MGVYKVKHLRLVFKSLLNFIVAIAMVVTTTCTFNTTKAKISFFANAQQEVISTTTSDILGSDTNAVLSYSCEFINRWTSSTHPVDYPSRSHWSPPLLFTHIPTASVWSAGVDASNGVQSVAEVSLFVCLFY